MMIGITTLLLLLLFYSNVQICHGQMNDPAMDVSVVVTAANTDAVYFRAGFGIEGRENKLGIKVYDKCRVNSPVQNLLSTWYPVAQATTIPGLSVDISHVLEPTGTEETFSVMPWSFDLFAIQNNPNIFTYIDATNAELTFCVRVELFIDDELATWDELDVFVPISMVSSLDGIEGALSAGCVRNTLTLSMTLVFDPMTTTRDQIEEIIAAALATFPVDESCSTDGIDVSASFDIGRRRIREDSRRLQDGATEVQVDVEITTVEPEGETVIDLETESDQFVAALDTEMTTELGESAGAASVDNFTVTVEEGGVDTISDESETFFEAYEFNMTLPDGALAAYFCDPITHAIMEAGGDTLTQGTVISVCFNVALDDLQFEVEDIRELHIGDTGGSGLTEAIVVDAVTVGTGYTHKFCGWTTSTMRTCVASFLLSSAFFEYTAATLTGYGAVLLELGSGRGGSSRGRQRRVLFEIDSPREWNEGDTGVTGFQVEPLEVRLQPYRQAARSSAAVGASCPSQWSQAVLWYGLISSIGAFVYSGSHPHRNR